MIERSPFSSNHAHSSFGHRSRVTDTWNGLSQSPVDWLGWYNHNVLFFDWSTFFVFNIMKNHCVKAEASGLVASWCAAKHAPVMHL